MKKNLLILCTGNSCRSQMAEGVVRQQLGEHLEVFSAGTHPTTVNPKAIEAMSEIGIDISKHRSKSVEEFLGQDIDLVLTVCDNAKESCPTFPAKTETIHISFEDPAEATGTDEEIMAVFRSVRDEISDRLISALESSLAQSRP